MEIFFLVLKIDKKFVDMIPDLKTHDGKYNFTDGVGQISSALNLQVNEHWIF